MDNKKIVIFGGGTVFHVRNHLALRAKEIEPDDLTAVAAGTTAERLAELAKVYLPTMDVDLRLTKLADRQSKIATNADIAASVEECLVDDTTKVIVMSAALCDYEGFVLETDGFGFVHETPSGKYAERLKTEDGEIMLRLKPASKIINKIRKERKDIFLVGFKTTCGVSEDEQYIAGLNLCKKASCNLVFTNDTKTRTNMIVTPEEARYHVSKNREETERGLMEMIFHRTHLTFTRSTVVAGNPISWDSPEIPETLRTVVNYCIEKNAYKPFNGVTAGHFACKVNDTTFLTSIRKTNFNKLPEVGLVKIVTDGPDTVLAYGAKPSVGGQSQRIVFHDHPGLDSIVHFHVPKKENSLVPTVSQREFECGSHECGRNTSNGLKQFGKVWAVYLDNHGPNIVFNSAETKPEEVIAFIDENFDLDQKTGGFVSIRSRLDTPNTLETAQTLL